MNFLPFGAVAGAAKGAAIGTAKGINKIKGSTTSEPSKSMADIVKEEFADESAQISAESAPEMDLGTRIAKDRAMDEAQVARLEHVLNKENKPLDTITVDHQGRAMHPDELAAQRSFEKGMAAEEAIAKRQEALEYDVARQTALDMGAAERARQEAAGTGYAEWKEAQRVAAEQRLPRTEEPTIPFQKSEAPYGLADEPYRYEGAIEPDTFEKAALPVQVADMLRTGDVPPNPFDRYSPQQAANRILREGVSESCRWITTCYCIIRHTM